MTVPDQMKTKKRSRPRTKRISRWSQIDEKMKKRWVKVFNVKFQNFESLWTLDVITNECLSTNEWQHLEEKLSMACKCKDCNHVWVTDNGVVYFYYSLKKSENGETVGKSLVWVKPQSCPNKGKCDSVNLPLIDVYEDEVEAVLSYLMMEIGWRCYQINYTKDEENRIESNRILRERKVTKEKKNQKEAKEKGSKKLKVSKLNSNIASLDQSSASSLQIPKSNVSKVSSTIATKRITKLKTRWDKSLDQIKREWELSFQNKFEYFTNRNPSHKWNMTLEKVTKDHPLRREQIWERFLGEKVEAGFKCPKCEYVWESKRAWISFWIWQSPPNNDGDRIGHVAVHILGQKCVKCPGNSNNKQYYTGDLQPEEIDAVLNFLLMDIDYHFYGNTNYTHFDEEKIEKNRNKTPVHYFGKGIHQKELCRPCQQNVCKKSVTAVYPNAVVPSQ